MILEGTTNITGGITTSTFPSIPDVPVSSFLLDLPMGPNSALASAGNLCSKALIMPTTITAQSGTQIKQNTIINVADCPFGSFRHKIRILHRKIVGHTLILTVQSLEAGRITGRRKGPADGTSNSPQTGDRNIEAPAHARREEGPAWQGAKASPADAARTRHAEAAAQGRIEFFRRQQGRRSSADMERGLSSAQG